MSAMIRRVVTLLSILPALFLAVAGGDSAHAGSAGPAGLLASVDCSASTHGDAPSPACPHDMHCCVLASAMASPPDRFRAFVLFRPEPGEARLIDPDAEEADRGPEPSPPWASRAPPPVA
jgi:hypothetical protein